MADRPKLSARPAPRDPTRRPVRPGAPPRPAPANPARPTQTRPAAPRPATPTAPPPAIEGVRISKLITERGIASRREADEWIEAGWVRVDGRLAVLGQRAAPDVRIDIDPKARNEQARRVTVLLNKPIGS